MDKSRHPGINFDDVFLRQVTARIPDSNETGGRFVFDIDVDSSFSPDGATLTEVLILKVSAIDDQDTPLDFSVEFSLVGLFSRSEEQPNLALEKFAEVQAPALLMPFAREFLHTLTMKSRWHDVLMPPINVVAYLRSKRKRADQTSDPHC